MFMLNSSIGLLFVMSVRPADLLEIKTKNGFVDSKS